MSKIDGNKTIRYLNEKWQGRGCPLCGGKAWDLTDKAFELREFNDGDIVLGGPNNAIIPLVPVTCQKCGNTVLINAIQAGLVGVENAR